MSQSTCKDPSGHLRGVYYFVIPMKKECPEFVRNLSKKLTVQIPDISIVRKVIQKMSVSGRCNLSGNRPEFVQVRNLFRKLICDHFLEHFLDNGNVQNLFTNLLGNYYFYYTIVCNLN